MAINKNKIKRILTAFTWVLVGTGCIVLLVSAVHSKDAKRCKGVDIDIAGVSNNYFIDNNDVYAIIKNHGGDSTKHQSLASIDLKKIEGELEKDVWIKNAELFFDNNDVLKVFVEEREPVSRIFTTSGNTFYIDSSCMMLPLSEKFSARVPVFTGFTSDAKILSKPDSMLLKNIKDLSVRIAADSFLMGMIDQVDIDAQRNFEMVPKIGNQNILFGDASDAGAKFEKLKLFYKDVITKSGWNRYNVIDLQYKDQVVAKIRGKEDILADSLRTLELIKFIADDAAKRSADSAQTIVQDSHSNTADSSIIEQSMQRDEYENGGTDQGETAAPVQNTTVPATATPKPVVPKPVAVKPADKPKPAAAKPVTNTKPAVVKPAAKPVVKPADKPKPKPAAAVQKPPVKKPAAVMKPKPKPKPANDY